MSLNGYSWVEGNVPNRVDPTGMWGELPSMWAGCTTNLLLGTQQLGCQTLRTATTAPGGLGQFISQNFVDVSTGVQAMVVAWQNCTCELYRAHNITDFNHPSYQTVTLQLNQIRNSIGDFMSPYINSFSLQDEFQVLFGTAVLDPRVCQGFVSTDPPSPYITTPITTPNRPSVLDCMLNCRSQAAVMPCIDTECRFTQYFYAGNCTERCTGYNIPCSQDEVYSLLITFYSLPIFEISTAATVLSIIYSTLGLLINPSDSEAQASFDQALLTAGVQGVAETQKEQLLGRAAGALGVGLTGLSLIQMAANVRNCIAQTL